MKKILLFLCMFAMVAPFGFAGGAQEEEDDGQIVIGVSFSDFATERWPKEQALLTELGRAQGVQVISQVANQDAKLQNDQIENMVLQGADALIIIAQDGDAAATAVESAAAEGIPVIAYDRLIKTDQLAAYVSFDNTEVGRAQARGVLKVQDSGRFVLLGGSPTDNNAILFRNGQVEVLQPLIDNGTIEIVADQWVENWDPANALNLMENILTAQNNNVDAVVASNDGTALGALQALKAQGLAGNVPISGQDATLAGSKSIVEGELTMTVFKDIRKLSPLAMDMAIKFATGAPVSGLVDYSLADLTLDNSLSGDVSCFFLDVVEVDASNIYEEVVLTEFQPYDEVYRNISDGERASPSIILMDRTDSFLRFADLSKRFPGVLALDRVSFTVEHGTIHGLCGENGAGKSTLIKVLAGIYPANSYEGAVELEGEAIAFQNVHQSIDNGIAVVYQELELVNQLSVAENIFLGEEPLAWRRHQLAPALHGDAPAA